MSLPGWIVATLITTGCGRVGFDPSGGDARFAPCTGATGHDEDSDGVDDACDVCPHFPDDQSDSDGDTVGDACDPRVALAGDQIVWFDPFVTRDPRWVLEGPAVIGVDTLGSMGITNILARIPVVADNDLFEVAVQIGSGNSGNRQILIGLGDNVTGGVFYFCEIFSTNGGVTANMNLVEGDGNGFSNLATQPVQGPLEQLRMRLQFLDDGVEAGCDSTWPGAARIDAARPPIDRMFFVAASNSIDVKLEYVVQIHDGS